MSIEKNTTNTVHVVIADMYLKVEKALAVNAFIVNCIVVSVKNRFNFMIDFEYFIAFCTIHYLQLSLN